MSPLPSLIDPESNNFIKDFPGQNAVNCDALDAYAGPCLTTHPLNSINTELTSSSTKPTLGTGGFCVARYYQIFDQIFMWGQFRFGTAGIAAGLGVYIVQLPFNIVSNVPASTTIDAAPVVGNGSTFDANLNAGRLPLTVHLRAANQIMFGTRFNNGLGLRELRESGYLSWDVNDGVTWSLKAKRA